GALQCEGGGGAFPWLFPLAGIPAVFRCRGVSFAGELGAGALRRPQWRRASLCALGMALSGDWPRLPAAIFPAANRTEAAWVPDGVAGVQMAELVQPLGEYAEKLLGL